MTLTAVINPVVPINLLFPHQRVICPQSRQSAKYRIVTHNFTNDNLTYGNSPSYQSDHVQDNSNDLDPKPSVSCFRMKRDNEVGVCGMNLLLIIWYVAKTIYLL